MAKRRKSSAARAVSREIRRASQMGRPVTDHYAGLSKVIARTKKKVVGPTRPQPHVEIPAKAPSLRSNGIGGRTVQRKGRG